MCVPGKHKLCMVMGNGTGLGLGACFICLLCVEELVISSCFQNLKNALWMIIFSNDQEIFLMHNVD